jgi:serine/threonine protein kinase
MSTPSEPAADGKTPRTPKTSAPTASRNGALKNGQKPSPEASSGDLSPWKHRFMTALLDKLKGNGKPAAKPSNGEDLRSTDSVRYLLNDSTPPAGSRDDWLGETQVLGDSPARPMTFTYPPGSTPLPRYTIRRGIGIGGVGEVYFAVSDVGKEVAIKRIQRNLEVELRGVSHCLNLKHPNLVALYDICRDDNEQSWVLMEYVAGPNLRQVLDESPQGLSAAEVRRWFSAIASGVSHLHSAGLVHRDLKPGNVFDDLGVVKIGDYGLSKYISASHRGGHTESVGTFHYMAPEIGRGQYGREIDIYALGILLYELLTGQVPFDGESCHEIIVKHLTAIPDLEGIDEPYRSTIARCLEKDPAKRFSTVAEMMRFLGMSDATSPMIAVSEPQSSDHSEPVVATLVKESPPATAEHIGPAVVPPALPSASQPSSARPPSDEPVARAIRQSFADLNRWWTTLDRSPGAKAFLLLVAGFVLLVNTHWLLPLLSFIAIVYVPYYVVRQMVLHVSQQPTYAEAQRIASAAGAPRRPISRAHWRSHMRTDLRAKRSIHRVAELNTSWVAATFTALGLAFGACVIGLRSGTVDAMSIAPYGWIAIVVLLASLGMLGLGKLWERDEGEGLPRRLVLAGLGAGVGVAAYSLNEFLMLPIDQGLARDVDATTLPQAFYRDGVPVAAAMMAHFALLFAALRWWKSVDPLRRTRLSLWAVAVAVVTEWAVHQVLPIPQPAGMMIAGGIAIAVQMSAPWINPRTINQRGSHGLASKGATRTRSIA